MENSITMKEEGDEILVASDCLCKGGDWHSGDRLSFS